MLDIRNGSENVLWLPVIFTYSTYLLQEKAVDPKTRLLMYKMVNSGMLETITGCISTGKEYVVFHAYGGR